MTSLISSPRRSFRILAAVLVAGASLGAAVPASAGSRFDFLFDPTRVIDDHQYFLNRVVGDFGVPRPVLEPVLPHMKNLEPDLPVALFLSHASGQPLHVIVNLRVGGLPWCDVFQRVHVQPDVIFVGIDRDPGSPYGKAWGHWKKHGRGSRFSDSDISGLVGLQVGHRLVGASPYELARARGQGRTVVVAVAEKGGRGHGKGAHDGKGNGNAKGHENGHGNGKSNGKGNGKH
jgi:hypothetical protein